MFPRITNIRTVRVKVFALLAVMGATLVIGTVVSSKIVKSMHVVADWRVLSSEIVALSNELRIQTHQISQLKGTVLVQGPLGRLARGKADLELTFRKLRGGVAWGGSPEMSDPLLLDAIASSEQFWRNEVSQAVDMLLQEPADTFNLTETQRLLGELSVSIRASSRRMERLLEDKMDRFSSHQWSVFALNFLVLLLAAAILTRTESRIRQVAKTAERINAGELKTRACATGTDEIAVFARTFNQMTSKLILEKTTSERIVSSMGDMLIVVSTDGIILSANEATRWTSGHAPNELLGRSFRDLLHQETAFSEIRDQINGSGSYSSANLTLLKREGGHFPASVTGSALPSAEGTDKSFVFVIRDMTSFQLLLQESKHRAAAEAAAEAERSRATEIEQLYRELSELRAQAFEAGKLSELGEMASGIAHEINNPITIICGKALQLKSLAESGQLEADQITRIAEQVEQTGFRVAKIIKSLRLLARDGRTETMQPASVASIISDALDLCTEKFRNKGIRLEIGAIPGDLTVHCRKVQISQVLINLLNNAHDAVEDSREKVVQVGVTIAARNVEISVSDTGPGVPIPIREKIMQPFYTTKPVGKGTGLGLSISRSILASHNGEIGLDTDHLRTRFVIRLPLPQSEILKPA